MTLPKEMGTLGLMALCVSSMVWYNLCLYGIITVSIFPETFFPFGTSSYDVLVLSVNTFAIWFFAFPIGSMVFGTIGDQFGRKNALVITLLLMAFALTFISLLPTHAEVGFVAPLFVLVFSFIHGLAHGGQWAGILLLAVEKAPPDRRGFLAAFVQAGAPVGLIAACLILVVVRLNLTADEFIQWGWRIPLAMNFGLVAMALYVRYRWDETLESPRDGPARSLPIIETITRYRRKILILGGSTVALTLAYYIAVTFIALCAKELPRIPDGSMQVVPLLVVSFAVQIPALFYFAPRSDRYGRIRMCKSAVLLLALWSLVFFPVISTLSPIFIFLALCLMQIFMAMLAGPLAALYVELFKAPLRYSAISVGNQFGSLAGAVLGFFFVYLLFEVFDDNAWFKSVFIAGACQISWLFLHTLQRFGQAEDGLNPAR